MSQESTKVLKRILSVPDSTPTSALYLETGCRRITTTIKARRINYLQYLVKLPKEEMLSKFFHCQWLDSCQHDWTRLVRKDLEDFNLHVDLAVIEKKSEFSWKTLVKKKAKEYELERLILLKETKNKLKMKDKKYEKLMAQEYQTNLDVHLAKTVLRFRVRMERFNGNSGARDLPFPFLY